MYIFGNFNESSCKTVTVAAVSFSHYNA